MLNAVALLFILEIDDLLYKANMGPKGLRVTVGVLKARTRGRKC